MGLLRINGIRLLVLTLSLGLLGVAIQGCDKGLAEKLDQKKDERFDDAARKLQIVASQRRNASLASKLLFEMAANPLVRKSMRDNAVDNVHTALTALRATFLDKDGKPIKDDKGVAIEDLWGKYPALGRLEKRANIERSLSESNALAYAVEQMTNADNLDEIKANRKGLAFANEHKGNAFRNVWIAQVPRLRLEANLKCLESCRKECKEANWQLNCNGCAACYEGGPTTVANLKEAHKTSTGAAPQLMTGDKVSTKYLPRAAAVKLFDKSKHARFKAEPEEIQYYDGANGMGCYKGTLKASDGSLCTGDTTDRSAGVCDGMPNKKYPIVVAPSKHVVHLCRTAANEARDTGLVELYLNGNPSDEAFGELQLVDPWGRDYVYAFPSKRSKDDMAFDVCSGGPDGKSGTDDDVCNRGKALKDIKAYREELLGENARLTKEATTESRRPKGGNSVMVVQKILDNNLLLGAMEGVEAVQKGIGPLVAWRFFIGSWNTTVAYDVIKNEYRGTPTQKMVVKARAFDRESSEFWKYARENNLRSMGGVLERYTKFINNYIIDAEKDPKDACIAACGQIFNDASEEETNSVQACRLKCITQAGKDAVNACKVGLETRLKACPVAEGDAEQVANANECIRVSNTKSGRCLKAAFSRSMSSEEAKASAANNNHYVARPFMTEAAFDRVFLQMAANDRFFVQRWARNDKKLERKKDFYALAFDFPSKGNESDRGYFGRACQEAPALRGLCRATPDEQREAVALAPYFYRSHAQAREFLNSHGKLAKGSVEPNVTGAAQKVVSEMKPAEKAKHMAANPACTASSSSLEKEACARSEFQLAAKGVLAACKAANAKYRTDAVDPAMKVYKACKPNWEAAEKANKAKGEAKAAAAKKNKATYEACAKAETKKVKELRKKAVETFRECLSKAFMPTYEPNPGDAAEYVATISQYRGSLGRVLASIPEVVEDPKLPSSLSPHGGGGAGLTLGFSDSAGGVYMGIGTTMGARGNGETWTKVHEGTAVKAVDKALAEKIATTYQTIAKDAGKRDPRRLQIKAPGSLSAGLLAELLQAVPAQMPADPKAEEDGEEPTVVRKLTLLGRRRSDDSMKRTQIVMARPGPIEREVNSYYTFGGTKNQCTYVGAAGMNFGRSKGDGHVLVYADNKLSTARVVDCEWGADEKGECKPKPCYKQWERDPGTKKCVKSAKFKEVRDKDNKLVQPEEPEATWERTFAAPAAVGSGTLNKVHLNAARNNTQSWARQRSVEETKKKSDLGADYANLSKWLDDKKNRGTIRLFVPSTLSYEEMTTLLSATLFSCEDREFQTLTENNGKIEKNTYFLGCGVAKDRTHKVHLSVCGSGPVAPGGK
jgi:hypothetical protein